MAENHAGMPQTSADAFILHKKAKIISTDITKAMISMAGSRNVVIHEYQEMGMDILRSIVDNEYNSLIEFCRELDINIVS